MNIINKLNESEEISDERKNRVHYYENKIKSAKNKQEMKKIVREMFKDTDLINDIDLNDLVYEDVIPKLKEFGVEIIDYDDSSNLSAYETIIRADY